MRRLQLAIVGFGKLGQACATAIREDDQLALAGIVRRPESLGEPLPAPFASIPVAAHISDLDRVDAALVCVPTEQAPDAARDLLQHGTAIVECATLHGEALRDHQNELDRAASHRNVAAIVGAGWDPGALSLFRALFALLIPRGHTETSWHTGAGLHHTTAASAVSGVREALATEQHTVDGKVQRYVYVELDKGADPARVETTIKSDPLFLGEETLVFPVADIRALEEEGRGVLLERRGAAEATDHQMLLLEARYAEPALAAQVMVAAARAIPTCGRGAFTLLDLPLGYLWGVLKGRAKLEWL